jgi:hypothetical protein
MHTHRLPALAALITAGLLALTACSSGSNNAERDKSTADITAAVHDLQAALDDETTAVQAKGPDAKDRIEDVQATAHLEHGRLVTLAQRAPTSTQDFADAAEAWSQAVETSRTAILDQADQDTGTAALMNVTLTARTMDQEAAKLHITPWHKAAQS